jgi:hypothetical protein
MTDLLGSITFSIFSRMIPGMCQHSFSESLPGCSLRNCFHIHTDNLSTTYFHSYFIQHKEDSVPHLLLRSYWYVLDRSCSSSTTRTSISGLYYGFTLIIIALATVKRDEVTSYVGYCIFLQIQRSPNLQHKVAGHFGSESVREI